MRIGIDCSFLSPGPRHSGMGVYTAGLLQGLGATALGHEIHALGYGERPIDVPSQFPWHAIPLLPIGRANRWISHQVSLPLLARFLKLDVLHIPGVNLRLSQPGVPFLAPCPLVVTVHDAIPVAFYGRRGPSLPWRLRLGYNLALQAVRKAAVVITVSETSRADIEAHLPLDPHRIVVVHNGLPEVRRLADHEVDSLLDELRVSQPYLLYVGSYEPRKNVRGALSGYQLAASKGGLPPLVLVVEPESGHRDAVMASAAELGLGNRLVWRSALSDRQLAALYCGATLFIYPSLYEGFGFTALQALSYGVPTIAGDAGAAREILGNAALLVSPTEPSALAAAIVDLLENTEQRERMYNEGPQQASRFSWKQAALGTLACYEVAGSSFRCRSNSDTPPSGGE